MAEQENKEKKINRKISANEVNRFTYCPYQWYYGRIYGQKKMKEMYQQLGIGPSPDKANFKKGLEFHKEYYSKYEEKETQKSAMGVILLIVVIIIILGAISSLFGAH